MIKIALLLATIQSISCEWTLGLQMCDNSNEWTLHGLWPEKEDCGGSFDEGAISDLESVMQSKWRSCTEYHTTNQDFWQHEWTKHGTCSGLSEHDFFAAGLSLYSKYASLCSGANGKECELSCDGAQGPCSSSNQEMVQV
mmetsp:Transcript_39597/g.62894  ORF Transcript_39597/g.62894 Transcript_39597/m.62894 type:complete len:140 (-) Transcript_39597:195-614(-)